MTLRRDNPIIASNFCRRPLISRTSYPASLRWQVSRHTPMRSFFSTLSIMADNSSKLRPSSWPFPAMVSRQIFTFVSSCDRISLRAKATFSRPSSLVHVTAEPGCKTKSEIRIRQLFVFPPPKRTGPRSGPADRQR